MISSLPWSSSLLSALVSLERLCVECRKPNYCTCSGQSQPTQTVVTAQYTNHRSKSVLASSAPREIREEATPLWIGRDDRREIWFIPRKGDQCGAGASFIWSTSKNTILEQSQLRATGILTAIKTSSLHAFLFFSNLRYFCAPRTSLARPVCGNVWAFCVKNPKWYQNPLFMLRKGTTTIPAVPHVPKTPTALTPPPPSGKALGTTGFKDGDYSDSIA